MFPKSFESGFRKGSGEVWGAPAGEGALKSSLGPPRLHPSGTPNGLKLGQVSVRMALESVLIRILGCLGRVLGASGGIQGPFEQLFRSFFAFRAEKTSENDKKRQEMTGEGDQ